MKILALYSIKGGVGKTAAAVNLAYLAAAEGAKVILLDLDPQGSASYYFRMKPSKRCKGKNLVKGGKRFIENIRGTDYDNLDVLPSHLSYRNLDLLLGDLKNSRKRLREILEQFEGKYDLVFLDCPPNITLVSENIFHASDTLLVPLVPTTLSLLTYEQLQRFFVKSDLDRSKISIFFSMVERRKSLHCGIMEKLSHMETGVLKTLIPYSSDIEKMGIRREPVMRSRPRSAAALSYRDLWVEIKAVCLRNA